MVRVLKCQPEGKLDRYIEEQEPIMQWMVRWAAMSLSRFKVGRDGKTAYQRQTGNICGQEVVPFGERVLFKKLQDSVGRKRALATKWQEGIWLGHNRATAEALIGTRHGIEKAWTVRRRPDGERLDAELVGATRGTPQRMSEEMAGDEAEVQVEVSQGGQYDPDDLKPTKAGSRRRIYFQMTDF